MPPIGKGASGRVHRQQRLGAATRHECMLCGLTMPLDVARQGCMVCGRCCRRRRRHHAAHASSLLKPAWGLAFLPRSPCRPANGCSMRWPTASASTRESRTCASTCSGPPGGAFSSKPAPTKVGWRVGVYNSRLHCVSGGVAEQLDTPSVEVPPIPTPHAPIPALQWTHWSHVRE